MKVTIQSSISDVKEIEDSYTVNLQKFSNDVTILRNFSEEEPRKTTIHNDDDLERIRKLVRQVARMREHMRFEGIEPKEDYLIYQQQVMENDMGMNTTSRKAAEQLVDVIDVLAGRILLEGRWKDDNYPTTRAFEDAALFVRSTDWSRVPKRFRSPIVSTGEFSSVRLDWNDNGLAIELGFVGNGEDAQCGTYSYYARSETGKNINEYADRRIPASAGLNDDLAALLRRHARVKYQLKGEGMLSDKEIQEQLVARIDHFEGMPEEDRWPRGEWPARQAFDDARLFVRSTDWSRVPERFKGGNGHTRPYISLAEDGEVNFHWGFDGLHVDLGFYGDCGLGDRPELGERVPVPEGECGTYSYYACRRDESLPEADEHGSCDANVVEDCSAEAVPASQGLDEDLLGLLQRALAPAS